MTKLGGDQLSFGRVAEVIDRRWLPLVCSLLVFIICFAVSALYLTLSANFLQPSIEFISGRSATDPDAPWYLSRTFCVTLPFLLLSLPLSLSKKLSILQYTSTVAMVLMFYTAIVVTAYAFKPVDEICAVFLNKHNATTCENDYCCVVDLDGSESCCIGSTEAFAGSFSHFMNAFPIIITAFCCAPQAFSLYNDIINPSTKRMMIASSSAITFVLGLYFLVGMSGYFTYGSAISDDLLGSYPLTTEITVARLGVCFLTAVSFPLLLIPARDSTHPHCPQPTHWSWRYG